MKKILIATTALVGSASVAAAEFSFGGFGRVGIGYTEDATNAVTGASQEFRIEQRFRLTVTGTTESDAGVKFEGRIRVQTDEAADNSLPASGGFGAAGFAISSGGFRLDVGNVSDVLDSGDAVNYYGSGVGLTSFAEYNAAFDGFGAVGGFGNGAADTTTIKLRYTAGDLTVSASYSNDRAEAGQAFDIEEFQIGLGYSFGDYNVGAAFGTVDTSATADADFWAISFDGSIGNVGFGVIVGDSDAQTDVSYGLYATYDISAATELRFVFADGGNDVAGATDDATIAIGFIHSLGGGVSLRGGIGQNEAGSTIADLGVNFSF